MQKIINDPSRVVDEMVEGYLAAYAETVEATSNPRVLKYKRAPIPNKVGIVTGGGSGHKPAFAGYIGRNIVDAVAVGERGGGESCHGGKSQRSHRGCPKGHR